MPFIPAIFTVQAEFRYLQSGQKTENRLFFEYTSDPPVTEMENLGAQLLDWWTDNLKPLQNTLTSLREIYITNLTTGFSPTVSIVPTTGNTGTMTGSVLPNNSTITISFRTEGRGRSSRGRNYAVGLVEPNLGVGGQTVLQSFADDLVTAYNLLTTPPSTGWTWSIVSFYHDGAPRAEGLVIPVQSAVVVDLDLDSQRRRLPGRGK